MSSTYWQKNGLSLTRYCGAVGPEDRRRLQLTPSSGSKWSTLSREEALHFMRYARDVVRLGAKEAAAGAIVSCVAVETRGDKIGIRAGGVWTDLEGSDVITMCDATEREFA